MIGIRNLAALVAAACLLALPVGLRAQSTDGYHAIQVFPVVVDTASFVQRFNFQNSNAFGVTLTPRYYPGQGTTQLTPITCPNIVVPGNGETVVTSLRTMCPALGAGSQFGFLHLTNATGSGSQVYSAFSRVSNIAGAGFTVEAFPASTFSSANAVVTGIRRLAASGGAPAFQTNCFLANMPLFANPSPPTTQVHYVIRSSAGVQIGFGDVSLAAGGFVRILDIFSAGGAPAGDHNDATITFTIGTPGPALLNFCTVQDNTSFGADFRIAKAATSNLPTKFNPNTGPGPKDLIVPREVVMDTDLLGRPFTIPAGAFNNMHVVGYHAPDYGQCEIINPITGLVAAPSYGLEIRAVDDQGNTGGGGNDSVVVPDPGQGQGLYFGDKDDNDANGLVLLEVESNGQNTASARPYKLRCRTGSGMTPPHIVRYQQAGTEF